MAASARAMISDAECRFPVRVGIAVQADGFGRRLDAMSAWVNQNCGADGWRSTPTGLRGVVNDAIYFRDATLAAAFAARWCRQRLPEVADGSFVMRDDDPALPQRAYSHRTL